MFIYKSVKTVILLLALSIQGAMAAEFDHSLWDQLLNKHVAVINEYHATAVNYHGMLADRDQLNRYLNTLSALSEPDFDKMGRSSQLAFLINAYNAWTVELILTRYPDLGSIKDLGSFFSSPWSKEFIPLLGKKRSLDDIEHELIRGSERYKEPRIHFAVNCASISCPPLRKEAYQGDLLDEQLEQQTTRFLSDEDNNRFEDNRLKLSSIFKWYSKDFKKGWKGFHSLNDFLIHYADALLLSPGLIYRLQNRDLEIDYLDYDWGLNAN